MMIGYYNYTVILTYIGLAAGIAGILFAYGSIGLVPEPMYAILCLMLSGLCDMFDGKIARTKKNRTDSEKKFGIQIDSLCDLVCFGVLPMIIGVSIGLVSIYDLPVLIIYPLCAVIRLAYFNVKEEIQQKRTQEVSKEYEGLPVTSSALIFPLLFSFRNDLGTYFPTVYSIVMLVTAISFVTKFKLKKPTLRTILIILTIGFIELMWLLYKTHNL